MSRVLCEMMGTQHFMKFATSHGTYRFAAACQWTLPWSRRILSTPSYPHMSNGLFLSGSRLKFNMHFLTVPREIIHVLPIPYSLICLIEKHLERNINFVALQCAIFLHHVTSSHFSSSILLGSLLSEWAQNVPYNAKICCKTWGSHSCR